MTVDFWAISYPKDYAWLPFLWRSIDKYVTGFRRCVLVIEEQDQPPVDLPAYVDLKRCRNYRGTEVEGYWGQSIEGLRAHEYTDADVIWYLESDCVFTRRIDAASDQEYSIVTPMIVRAPWGTVGPAEKWRAPTARIIGYDPPSEMMRRHPFVFHRATIGAAWDLCGGEERLRREHDHISQFNILGCAALKYHREFYREVHTDSAASIPAPCMRQFWSHHTPDHPDVQRELKGILT